MSSLSERTRLIKQKARDLGFMFCGISRAEFLEEEAPRLEQWLHQNRHGQMHYMANHFDKRLDPTKLVEGSKSVVSLALNYFPEKQQRADTYKISRYAYGQDYHHVIKGKLRQLLEYIRDEIGEVQGRAFVDSAPVMDKAWAKKSGVGWIGKNSNLLIKGFGSYFFLAELIIDLELEHDGPATDHCGSCTACIDACPTEAITPYEVDGSKCISYLTIELKENIPQNFKGQMENWMFGCDVCQEVCPWNRFSQPHDVPEFEPKDEWLDFSKRDWEELTEETFKKVFQKSAVKRTKYEGLKRNIKFLKPEESTNST